MIDIDMLKHGLQELANRQSQQRLWLSAGNGDVGSLTEATAETFDDSGLGDALDSGGATSVLPSAAVDLLLQLDKAIDAVDRSQGPAATIAGPAMETVRNLAAAALRELS